RRNTAAWCSPPGTAWAPSWSPVRARGCRAPRRSPGGTFGGRSSRLLLQRVELELAEEDLVAFALEEDAARRRLDVRRLVHDHAVDRDGDLAALADAFDPRPLAHRALDVVLAPRVQQLLEVRIVVRPPELLSGIDRRRPALLPPRALVGAEH